MSDFKKLKVWEKAHELALRVHRAAAQIRGAQNVALRSQLTRAAQSVPSNVVEGATQERGREFIRFLGFAIASAAELEYHLITARDLRLIPDAEIDDLIARLVEVKKMLFGLRSRVLQRTR